MTSVFLKITIGMAISKTTISVKKEPVQDRVSKKKNTNVTLSLTIKIRSPHRVAQFVLDIVMAPLAV